MTAARAIASGFGIGFLPRAPGTWGSAAALPPGVLLLAVHPWLVVLASLLCAAIGLWAVRATAATDDPGWVVIDEIAGQLLALAALPEPTWLGVVAAFVLFRLFDILKPGPVGWADRRGGAAGVMADDLLAGLLAAGCLGGLAWLIGRPL